MREPRQLRKVVKPTGDAAASLKVEPAQAGAVRHVRQAVAAQPVAAVQHQLNQLPAARQRRQACDRKATNKGWTELVEPKVTAPRQVPCKLSD